MDRRAGMFELTGGKMVINDLIKRYPALEGTRNDFESAFNLLKECFSSGSKLLVAGNGGSMADSQHIVGELMKRFSIKRSLSNQLIQELLVYGDDGRYLAEMLEGALPAIALDAAPLTSAVVNDSGCGDTAFAQMINGLGKPGDVFWAITTSGNSRNVYLAAITARALGMKVLALTGMSGGIIKGIADVSICVPETETYKVQELHLPIYHALCLMLENEFFGT